MKNNAVIVFSGGLDSYTLLNDVIQRGGHDNVYAISFNYGQRHSKELVYAAQVTDELNIVHNVVDVAGLGESVMGGSSQTSDMPVPHGHYEAENMKATVVPNRNMIMLSLAMGYCVMKDAGTLYYGAHAGDHHIYKDCRPEFVYGMELMGKLATDIDIEICAPYLKIDKGDIVKIGLDLGLDYGKSWTCYEGGDKPCFKCGACQERAEAFNKNNMIDPLCA